MEVPDLDNLIIYSKTRARISVLGALFNKTKISYRTETKYY